MSNAKNNNGGGQQPAKRATIEQLFGTDDVFSPREIQAYLNQLRRVDRAACQEIADTAEVIQQVIARSPGVGILLGYDSRRRARMICEPLQEAANAHNAAANLAVLSWQRFIKHFGDTIEETRRSRGQAGRRTMNWEDV